MLTEKDLEQLRAERHADYMAEKAKMNPVARKLEKAIAAYDGETGPVIWSVSGKDKNSAYLIATYSEDHELEDEVWTQFGGNAIMITAGVVRHDGGGMDYFQDRFCYRLVSQWVLIHGDLHFSQSLLCPPAET